MKKPAYFWRDNRVFGFYNQTRFKLKHDGLIRLDEREQTGKKYCRNHRQCRTRRARSR